MKGIWKQVLEVSEFHSSCYYVGSNADYKVLLMKGREYHIRFTRGAQNRGARSPKRLNSLGSRLMFVGTQIKFVACQHYDA